MKSSVSAALAGLLLLPGSALATPVAVYSNFGPGDSFLNSVHDVLNQTGYLEHAARFVVPTGTNFFFTGVDVAIQDALIVNEGQESQLSVRLWSDEGGQPGTILESMITDVIAPSPNVLVQHIESNTSATALLHGTPYWISLAAIQPGRVGWFTNSTETGGYALNDPSRGVPWLVIDSAGAGAFRVYGEPTLVPEPSSVGLLGLGLLGFATLRRQVRGGSS
jgi:hypothetical protein